MTRRLLAALALLLWAAPAAAEQVRVRSGEHPGFTRLVIEFPDRPEWSIRTSEGRAELVLTPGERNFDLSEVFLRIPRDRIRDVVPSDAGLVLILGCACRVTAFEARRAALAIDVAGIGTAPPQGDVSEVEQTSATGDPAGDTAADAAGIVARTTAPEFGGPSPRPDPPAATIAQPAEAPASRGRPPAALPPVAPEAPPTPGAAPESDTSTLDRLAEGVARAASQGVVRLAPRPEGAGPQGTAELQIGGVPDTNLRLRIAGEEDWTEEPGRDERCLDDDAFDLAAWAPVEAEPTALIAAARGRLAEQVDLVDEDRAVDLARIYIGLGFGAEARAVVASLAPRSPEATVLTALAHIVDDDPLPIPGLAEQEGCPGRAQLWVALATGRAGVPDDTLVAVGELPLSLRRHIAARLIPLFLEAGDPATAEAIRATVRRAAGPHGDGFDLAAAQIDAEGQNLSGLDTIRDIAGGASPESDKALELYLALGNESGSSAEPPVLARAETRADDLRGTDTGTRIEAELIVAATRTGAFDLAGTRLAAALEAGSLPEARRDTLVAEYVAALADAPSDEVVLVNAAAFERAFAPLAARGDAGSKLAARLADLGFPRLARAYAATGEAADVALEARLLLLAGDARAALAKLDAVAEPEARHLEMRAAVLLALDRPAEAAEVYELLGDKQGAARASRTSQTGSAAPASSGPGSADATGVEDRPRDPAALPDLVAASESARAGIEALLRDLPTP